MTKNEALAPFSAHAPIVTIERIDATQYSVICPSGAYVGHVDVIRGFSHYTGRRGTTHAGITAVIRNHPGNGPEAIIEALAAGLRNGRDDRA